MTSKKIIGLLLTASLILSGCSAKTKTPVNSVDNTQKEAVVTSETTSETTHKPFEFNPHVYSAKLA